jgi:hypothetical protein
MLIPKKKRRRKKRYHTGEHTSPKLVGECSYRSGWELKYMQYLDADPSVASYSYESVKIPYVSNSRTGRVRTYYPDILITHVDGTLVLVEIKPSKRLVQTIVKKKLAAAEGWCRTNGATLVIITEKELKGLRLL